MADSRLDFLFCPRSLAVVGASPNPDKQGYRYASQLVSFRFRGNLYLVNPRGGDLFGCKVYRSLAEVPGEVDYVVSTIPASAVLGLIEECASKKVKVLQMYTAHLAETGQKEGKELQDQIVAAARAKGLRLLGPNCMGVYHPKVGLSFRYNFPRESGTAAFISQSAGHTAEVVHRAAARGVRFSKVVSYGNAADINETDLLVYLGEDDETRVIASYIEGVSDVPRFLKVLARATRAKPVIVLKVGRTEAGSRATTSHTGSLAGSHSLWQAALSQCGAVQVDSVEELIDLLVTFYFLPVARGATMGVIGAGGGGSILSADECESRGLRVPPLPADVVEEVKKLVGDEWVLVKNPVDTSVIFPAGWTHEELRRIFELIARNPLFDVLMADVGEWMPDIPEEIPRFHALLDTYLDVARTSGKPMAIIIRSGDYFEDWRWKLTMEGQARCTEAGFPVYPTIARAAQALSQFIRYHLRRSAEGQTL